MCFFFFSSRRRHTRSDRDWSSDVCSSDLALEKSGVRSVAAIAERSSDGQVQIVRGVECEPVRAGSVVLASGRFLGGGIRCEADGRLRETVFDLPARAAGRDALAALPNERLFA